LTIGTDTCVEPAALHHVSHNHLLDMSKPAEHDQASIDAIIVPTARPIAYLRKAITLAGELNCRLVALCSIRASAADVKREAAKAGVDFLAIDTDLVPDGVVPNFETSAMLRGVRFDRRTDTSFKRNLGLLLAKIAGWERIVFLDDDISVSRADDLRDAAGLLYSHAVVGLKNGGYPDNSVVCHAYREVGGPQDTFIGGGALAVGAVSFTSFFPNIYNEDWFFLLDDDRLRTTGVTGLAVQSPYDPFANDRRARSEELGDCLAEGIFSILDNGGRVQDADVVYWKGFIRKRRRFIENVLSRVEGVDGEPGEKGRMVAALKAARGRNLLIEPKLCVDYLAAWRADRDCWAKHLDDLGQKHTQGLAKALAELGVMYLSQGRLDQDVARFQAGLAGTVRQSLVVGADHRRMAPVPIAEPLVEPTGAHILDIHGEGHTVVISQAEEPLGGQDQSRADAEIPVIMVDLEMVDQGDSRQVLADFLLVGGSHPHVDTAEKQPC